jgi:hypothetical protein
MLVLQQRWPSSHSVLSRSFPHNLGMTLQAPQGDLWSKQFHKLLGEMLNPSLSGVLGPTENTHIRGLVPSVMPHVIHHAGEQAQAGWDVVREQEDAEGLRREWQRNRYHMQVTIAHRGFTECTTGMVPFGFSETYHLHPPA